MKSVKEIVEEISNLYTSQTRSIDPKKGHCLYNGPKDRVCAFAYMIKPELKHKLKEGQTASNHIENQIVTKDDFKEGYYGHPIGFYVELQTLHDDPRYWDETGLSFLGKIQAHSIINKYRNIYEVLQIRS